MRAMGSSFGAGVIGLLVLCGCEPQENVIELEDGVYRLDRPKCLGSERSGTPERPVVWRAKNRGKVTVSGAVVISDWKKTELCDGRVWVGTIPGSGEIPGWATAGCPHALDERTFESPISVFEKGVRLTCARWPKTGWAMIREVLPAGTESGCTFGVGAAADVAAWAGEKDLWTHGLWNFEWADAKCRVLTVDVARRTLRIDTSMVKFGVLPGRDFYVFNALSALSGPGEWFVDRKARRLYVWPKGDVRDIEVALCDHLVVAKGLANARFEGIVFEGARKEAFLMESVTNVVFDACCFRRTSKSAIRATGAKSLLVKGSDFYDLGEGALWIEGGDGATLARGDNVVDNCHISHFGRVTANYRPGICMNGSGNAITHNLIHHTDHQAIQFNCSDLYIGWNVIHDTLQHNNDAGAVYCCGQQGRGWTDMRGTLIEHNFIHRTGRPHHAKNCMALYFDDSSSGIRARYNFINRADIGVYGGGGNLNRIESNLLVACSWPIKQGNRGPDTRFFNGAQKGKEGPLWKQLVKRHSSPAWAARFPETARILALADGRFAHWPLYNRFVGNVEVGCGEEDRKPVNEKFGNVWEGNRKLADATGCIGFLGRDWRLDPASESFAALGGDLGFERAGLYDSQRRFSPAVKFGADVSKVEPPAPELNLDPGTVVVQIRPERAFGGGKKVCFAKDLVGCAPIRGFENILECAPQGNAPREWAVYSFSFTPTNDLKATIHLRGRWWGDWTAYDDFSVEGAVVQDDLETGTGWSEYLEINKPPRNLVPGKAGMVDETTRSFRAASGHRFALAHGECHFVHPVELKKDRRVTVVFKARNAETQQE